MAYTPGEFSAATDAHYRKCFKEYISQIPSNILGSLVIKNPGEGWRLIILNEMIQKGIVSFPKQILIEFEKVKKKNEINKMIIDFYNGKSIVSNENYDAFKMYWCACIISVNENNVNSLDTNVDGKHYHGSKLDKNKCPTKIDVQTIIKDYLAREEKVKNMSDFDFSLQKLAILT